MSRIDGRKDVFQGRKFDELDDEEKFTKYGTNCLSEGVKNGIRLIEQGGNVKKAIELAASMGKGDTSGGFPTDVGNQAKKIALKLMNNEELTQEEEVFLVEHEDAIEKELE